MKVTRSAFFVYILQCSDGTYYIGSTNNLERRVHEHNHVKKGARYTKTRRPVALVHSESFLTLHDARVREYELKTWTRVRKEKLFKRIID